MSFRNIQIDSDDLPRADQIEFRPLAASYPREVLVQGLLTWGPLFLIASLPALLVVDSIAEEFGLNLFAMRILLSLLTLIPLTLGVVLIPFAVRRARTAGFALREHDIAYRRGVLFHKVVILPFNRVQHGEVSSGPLQRRFGLASLKLYTAGASGVDLQIDGLTPELAASLRDHVTTGIEDRVAD